MTTPPDDLEQTVDLLLENIELKEKVGRLEQQLDQVPPQYKSSPDPDQLALFERYKSLLEQLCHTHQKKYEYQQDYKKEHSIDMQEFISGLYPADRQLFTPIKKECLESFLGEWSEFHNYYYKENNINSNKMMTYAKIGGILGCIVGFGGGCCYADNTLDWSNDTHKFFFGVMTSIGGSLFGGITGSLFGGNSTLLKKKEHDQEVLIDRYAQQLTEIWVS